MFLLQCILVSLLAGLLRWDGRVFGQSLADTPLCVGVLVGIIMGDPAKGLVTGATLQLIFMGIVGIGGATPPDSMIGAVVATVFAIHSGLETEEVVALAMPIAVLGQTLGILSRVINTRFNIVIDKAASEGDTKAIDRSLWSGAIIFFVLTVVPVFLGCYLGAPVIQKIIDFLPEFIVKGLSRSSSLLPALGMALLMQFMYDRRTVAFLFIGFVLSAYLGLSTLGITILGVCMALILYNIKKQQATSKSNIVVDEDDF